MNVSWTSLFWIVAARSILPSWRTVVSRRLPATFVTLAMSIPTPFWLEMTYSPAARGWLGARRARGDRVRAHGVHPADPEDGIELDLRGLARVGEVDDVDARDRLVDRVEVDRQRRQQRELLDRQVGGLAVGREVDERAAVDVLEQLVALGRVVAREELRLRGVRDVEEQHAALGVGDRDGGDVGLDVHLAEDDVRAVLELVGQRRERDLLHPAGERVLGDVVVAVAVADRHRLRGRPRCTGRPAPAPGAASRSATSRRRRRPSARPASEPNRPRACSARPAPMTCASPGCAAAPAGSSARDAASSVSEIGSRWRSIGASYRVGRRSGCQLHSRAMSRRQDDRRLRPRDLRPRPDPLDGRLEVRDVGRAHVDERVGVAAHRVRRDDLGLTGERLAQRARAHVRRAVDLDERLGVLAERAGVDERGEARDDAGRAQPVDAPLDRRRGEAHALAELGEAQPAVLEQLGDDVAIDLVHARQRMPGAAASALLDLAGEPRVPRAPVAPGEKRPHASSRWSSTYCMFASQTSIAIAKKSIVAGSRW